MKCMAAQKAPVAKDKMLEMEKALLALEKVESQNSNKAQTPRSSTTS